MKKIFYVLVVVICLVIFTSCNNQNKEKDNALEKALTDINSYHYQVGYNAIGIYQNYVYEYQSGNIKTSNHNNDYILIYNEDNAQYYINYNSDYFVNENDEEYSFYMSYFREFHLNKIIPSNYIKKEDYYSVKPVHLQKEFTNIFNNKNNEYICKSIEISLEFGNITDINFVVEYQNKEYQIYVYICCINEISFDIPDIPNGENKTISDILYPKEIKVNVGTLLEDIINDIVFEVVYNNNEVVEIYAKELNIIFKDYDPYFENEYTVEFKLDETHIVKIKIIVENNEQTNIMSLQQYGDTKGITYGLPSIGNSKALVIPVSFVDYKAPAFMKSDLEKAFFGNSTDTGWESLSSYYFKSSYGKLNITGTVLDVYNTGKKSSYYQKKYSQGEDADYEIIKEALNYYNDQINYDDYDSNKDGYIDSLYIVYTTPIDFVNNDTLWWAYTYEYLTPNYEYYDNVEVDYYCFLGYEFLFERAASGKHIILNAETIIHETGHMLGLNDYYDYDKSTGPNGGIGGGDMMDFNIGDHNPFSKLLMGWVTPIVVSESQSLELNKFSQTGECVIILDKFNNTYFDEYYIIDYYTPTDLNELEAGYQGLFSEAGIRVYHVDARIDYDENESLMSIFKYNNSFTDHRLISLVQASGTNSINYGRFSTNADLFKASMSYKINSWYSASSKSFNLNVVSIDEKAILNISVI